MGRPRKVKTREQILAEIEALKKQLPEEGQETKKFDGAVTSDVEEIREIRPDEYITVMSLLPYTLILTTQPLGGGSVKRFTKFGETKRILYSDLVDILESCKSFAEAGYFYIMDKSVVRRHGLDDLYSRILTKEKIQEIVDNQADNSVALYNSANPLQQETIIQMLIEKVTVSPEAVDMNVVDKISRVSGIDIAKRAKEESTEEEKEEEAEK